MRNLRPAPICALLFSVAVGVIAVLSSRAGDWTPPEMLALLAVFTLVADRFEVRTRSGVYVSGSMPCFVLVAVLFGPAPAAALGATVALVQVKKGWDVRLGDLATLAGFELVAGLVARAGQVPNPVDNWLWFMAFVAGVYMLTAVVNFGFVAVYMRALRGRSFSMNIASTWRPILNSQLVHAIGTAGLAYAYLRIGSAVIVFAGALAMTFSRLLRDLMEAERLRDEAHERNEELAAANERLRRAHFGAMRSLVRSIHLHDRMTARHSAAVARYARGIARAAGCSDEQQQLVHTAGLLHDVGKHILDDAILKGDTKLDDEQWELVKRHPEEGARIVRMLEGQEAVAEIIHAHHERIDGRGYPRGLAGDDVPLLSRMISIADTYDVMTARDSYRDPVSSAEAVAELRRVSGAQLDGDLVEIFIHEVVGHQDTAFAHNDDADFETELAGGVVEAATSDEVADAGDHEPQLSAA
jgi:putative nucleotidyltransferase with HDIG domain